MIQGKGDLKEDVPDLVFVHWGVCPLGSANEGPEVTGSAVLTVRIGDDREAR